MDHPHSAKLLDAGTTECSPLAPREESAPADRFPLAEREGYFGQPYFVMEQVKGIPLTEYCDAHKLSIPERLTLFVQICSAVQHAYQKGIIHRDLKPGNILVESHDGKPVPKVIDFGLAKATSGLQLAEHSLFTAFGSVMGTPLYMAPEQASFNAIDVDTRADVYALGVILYELLAAAAVRVLGFVALLAALRPIGQVNVASVRRLQGQKLGLQGGRHRMRPQVLASEESRHLRAVAGFGTHGTRAAPVQAERRHATDDRAERSLVRARRLQTPRVSRQRVLHNRGRDSFSVGGGLGFWSDEFEPSCRKMRNFQTGGAGLCRPDINFNRVWNIPTEAVRGLSADEFQQFRRGGGRKLGVVDVQIEFDQLEPVRPVPQALKERRVGFGPPERLPLGVDRGDALQRH